MRHLFDLQGADGTRLLLQEMNSKQTTTSRMIAAVLDTIQMEARLDCLDFAGEASLVWI
jgi:hypothetical protein